MAEHARFHTVVAEAFGVCRTDAVQIGESLFFPSLLFVFFVLILVPNHGSVSDVGSKQAGRQAYAGS